MDLNTPEWLLISPRTTNLLQIYKFTNLELRKGKKRKVPQ